MRMSMGWTIFYLWQFAIGLVFLLLPQAFILSDLFGGSQRFWLRLNITMGFFNVAMPVMHFGATLISGDKT